MLACPNEIPDGEGWQQRKTAGSSFLLASYHCQHSPQFMVDAPVETVMVSPLTAAQIKIKIARVLLAKIRQLRTEGLPLS